jgi:cell division protein FtsB
MNYIIIALRRILRIIASPVMIVVLFLLVVLFGYSAIRMHTRLRYVQNMTTDKEVELMQIEEKEAKLEESLDFLKTERGQEEELHNRFRITQPGESLILIVDSGEIEIEEPEKRTFFLWRWLGID